MLHQVEGVFEERDEDKAYVSRKDFTRENSRETDLFRLVYKAFFSKGTTAKVTCVRRLFFLKMLWGGGGGGGYPPHLRWFLGWMICSLPQRANKSILESL